jgi:CBS domain containing-hemolysin-like protein
MVAVYLLIAIGLLALNAFFVLAEFATVKVRPTQIEELIDEGSGRARAAKHILDHLDEYLSVCQLGITFASIGLGFVAEPAVVRLIEPLLLLTGVLPAQGTSQWLTVHGVAFVISYLLVSFLHILAGELLPKSVAIRLAEKMSLATARPLRLFRFLFFVPLWVLNLSANSILALMGFRDTLREEDHSENELRILLEQSQSRGLISFRRLLYMENVFDLGELRVRDAMRPRSQVRCLRVSDSWADNLAVMRTYRFSRYPLITADPEHPRGLVHLKDILLAGNAEQDLTKIMRPCLFVRDDAILEALLAEMQRKRIHVALVMDHRERWTGFITLEDVIEEIVGTIRDEFEEEEVIHLVDVMSAGQIFLDIEAEGPIAAVRCALQRMDDALVPLPRDHIVRAVDERERLVGTYLGRNLGMPHARMAGLKKPFVMMLRSDQGIRYRGTNEKAHLLFVLLTPAGQPRIHQRLQAVIATMLDESEYVPDRLRTAATPEEVMEIIRAGEQATLD